MSDRLLLGLDIGTTHCKAGLVQPNGDLLRVATRPTPLSHDEEGRPFYDPETLWQSALEVLREVMASHAVRVAALGIASMAESGLLVDRASGEPRSPVLPWFDRRTTAQAEQVAQADVDGERFRRTGLPSSFKYGLPKILWLRAQDRGITRGACWLSVADYLAYRLTGEMWTDPTLAARTYAFDVPEQRWDGAWLARWEIDVSLFPPVRGSGVPGGAVMRGDVGIAHGTPVAIAGHDHLCAAVAAGGLPPGVVFNSMGTAEALLGALESWATVEDEGPPSGLTFGRHVLTERLLWLGGMSASGGSVEWARALLGDPPLDYGSLERLLEAASDAPTGIFYFPYLSGSGAPHPNARARAALVGLTADHGRADLFKAVLEGTAFETEAIRRRAEAVTGISIERVVATGGGTRNRGWLQIKADVMGCPIEVLPVAEATLVGAALTAGLGCGLIAEVPPRPDAATVVQPDAERHAAYRRLFEAGYAALQPLVRKGVGCEP